jgi:hypothetical protein
MSPPWSDDPDPKPEDGRPTPSGQGIALCLAQLADEAAELRLPDTFAAIRRAIGTCLLETSDRDLTGARRMH